MKIYFTKHAIQRLQERYGYSINDILKLKGTTCPIVRDRKYLFIFLPNGIVLSCKEEKNKLIVLTILYTFYLSKSIHLKIDKGIMDEIEFDPVILKFKNVWVKS